MYEQMHVPGYESTEEALCDLSEWFDVKDLHQVNKSVRNVVIQDLQCLVYLCYIVSGRMCVLE